MWKRYLVLVYIYFNSIYMVVTQVLLLFQINYLIKLTHQIKVYIQYIVYSKHSSFMHLDIFVIYATPPASFQKHIN